MAIIAALELLRGYPEIDVKVCTAVTQWNIDDVVNISEAWRKNRAPNQEEVKKG